MNPYIQQLIDDRQRLLSFTMYQTGRDRSFSEDVLQECYVKAITHINQFTSRPGRSVGNWMRAIIINHIFSERRKAKFCDYHADIWDLPEDPYRLDETPPVCHLEDAIRVLGETLRPHELKLLIDFAAGMEYEAIAAVEGVPVGTVKSRMARTRDKIAEMEDFK